MAPNSDPFASIATPVQNPDPFSSIATPIAKRPDPVQSPDTPSDASLYWRALTNPVGEGVKSATSPLGAAEQVGGQAIDAISKIPHAVMHPIDTMKALGDEFYPDDPTQTPGIVKQVRDAATGLVHGQPLAAENLAGQTLGSLEGGRIAGAGAAKVASTVRGVPAAVSRFSSAARNAAIGDPDAAALKGLRVSSGSPKALGTIKDVNAAKPYLQGAESLEDLQSRIPDAKNEIWSPYQKVIEDYGDKQVTGPDGPTTLRALEQERLQTSAQLRALKSRDPQAVQTAIQKGQGEADLIAREKAIKAAMDPHLEEAGINPTEIRSRFGAVSRVGQRVAGKTTLADPSQPYGAGKLADLSAADLLHPLNAVKKAGSAAGDVVAGRPLVSGKPVDVAIKSAFRKAPPKPDLGTPLPRQPEILPPEPAPPAIKGLLQAPERDVPLKAPKTAYQQGVLRTREPGAGQRPTLDQFGRVINHEEHIQGGQTSVAASVPSEVNDLLERTGAKITNNEAPTSKVVASVDPDEPNNINIDDKERFSKDKNAAAQTLSHEAVHVWHNNLPPEIQKMIPADDPKDPYHKNGYEPDELQNMRAQGLKLYNLPRERAATVIQKYSHLGGSNAPKEVRDVYEPWAKDMTTSPLSTVMPTSGNQQGINTDVRPPGSAPMPETQIFPEEKEKPEGNSEKSEGKTGPKHPSGDITGFDEETGLPIVKRKAAVTNGEDKAKKSSNDVAKPEATSESKEVKPKPKVDASTKTETEHKYKFGNTQVDLPPDSDAHKAIKSMQSKIDPAHLSDVHEDQDKPHVTVRYGVKDGDKSKMKDYLSKQAPFEAKLGKTMSFPPSEHSEGAAPIVAQVHSPDLHRMNGEIEKHGDFEPSNFPDYKPHVTVAYVKPEHAAKYVGMNDGEGKTFKVGSVGVGDRDGNKEDVKLSGDVPAPKSPPKGEAEPEQKASEKPGAFKVGDKVMLPDGTGATVAYVPSKNSQLPTYRFKTDDGKTRELRTSQMGRVKAAEESADGKTPPPGHTVVTTHFRKLPNR